MSMYDEEEIPVATEAQKKLIEKLKKMEGKEVQVIGYNGEEITKGKAEVFDRCLVIDTSNGRFVFPTVKYNYLRMVDVMDCKVLLGVTI